MTTFRTIKLDSDNAVGDAFSRLRVSDTGEVFSMQAQYNAEPLIMEGGATGTGVAPAHNANTRMVALSATAGSGARVPLVAIRPKTTFNSITNRSLFELLELNLLCTGANPVYWELVVGGNYSGQTYADVNTTYSGFEYTSVPGSYTNLTGGIVIDSGYIGGIGAGAAAAPPTVTPISIPPLISRKYPISLDRAGNVRSLGTMTVLVTGIGGTSACRGSMTFKEIR